MNLNDLYNSGYIQLSNDWFKVRDGTNLIQQVGTEGFFLYVYLLYKTYTYRNYICFNRELISEVFGGIRTEYTTIAYKALKSLVNNNIIELEKKIDFNKPKSENFIRAKIKTDNIDKNYFSLFDEHLIKILNCKNVKQYKLLALYCAIRYRTFDNQYGKTTYKILSNETGINEKTLIKYVDIIKNLGIIKYDNAGTRYFNSTNTYKQSPNIYVLNTDDCDYILSTAIKNYKEEQIKLGVQIITNEQYNQLINERRVNTGKKKRADIMYTNGKLDEVEYIKIQNNYEENKVKLQIVK